MKLKTANMTIFLFFLIPFIVLICLLFIEVYFFMLPGSLPDNADGSCYSILKTYFGIYLPYLFSIIAALTVMKINELEKSTVEKTVFFICALCVIAYQISIIGFTILFYKNEYYNSLDYLKELAGVSDSFKYFMPAVLTLFYLKPELKKIRR